MDVRLRAIEDKVDAMQPEANHAFCGTRAKVLVL
jgi:hypothetical protein